MGAWVYIRDRVYRQITRLWGERNIAICVGPHACGDLGLQQWHRDYVSRGTGDPTETEYRQQERASPLPSASAQALPGGHSWHGDPTASRYLLLFARTDGGLDDGAGIVYRLRFRPSARMYPGVTPRHARA